MINNYLISGVMEKKGIGKELRNIKEQLEKLSTINNSKNLEFLKEKGKTEETNTNLLSLLKFMVDENRKTTMVLKNISDAISQMNSDISNEDEEVVEEKSHNTTLEEIPLSELDAKIIQFAQIKDMVCADDIKKLMNYKGRNAAAARLTNLYKRNLLKRYQLGHKVYYKFDAGKATNTLIISPPINNK
jgi:hypothetical protein